jgi:hypothetical protein
VKPSRVAEVMSELLETKWPMFLWGAPGVGKSSIVRSIAEDKGLPLIDVRASLLDPTDLRGIPTVENGKAVWCPPGFLPGSDQPEGLLFFDELNAAPTLVQSSLYQLTLDRRVGEYELPDGWKIIAAGNRAEDASVTFRTPAALLNRFVHFDFEADFDDWKAWAVSSGVHHRVTAFLGTRRELLLNMDGADKAFPTPRSWEILSDAAHRLGVSAHAIDVFVGIVGEGAAMEFLGFCDSAITEEKIQVILDDPSNAELPKKLGDQYALISYLCASATEKQVRNAAGELLNRLSPELGVLLARDMLHANPAFVREKGYLEFVKAHRELLE